MKPAQFTLFALLIACSPSNAEDAPSIGEAADQPAVVTDSAQSAVNAQAIATANVDVAAAVKELPPPPSLTRIYHYFGITGISSILFWMAALLLLVAYVRLPLVRTKKFSMALGLAAAGFFLSELNSGNISAIMVDRSKEIEEARASQAERERLEGEVEGNESGKKKGNAGALSDINMGDEDKEPTSEENTGRAARDKQIEGEGEGEKQSIYEKAAAGEEAVPLYKLRGKQQRAESKAEENTEIRKAAAAGDDQQSGLGGAQQVVLMPEADKILADKLDMLNLFVAKWILVLALGMVVWDYLSRFNETFDAVLPLPIAGPWLDRLYPKKHIVLAKRPTPEELRDFLLKVVRKGETFIYLGQDAQLNETLIARLWLNLGQRINSIFNRIGLWLEDPESHPFPGISKVCQFLSRDSRLSRILTHLSNRALFIFIMLPIVLCGMQSLLWLVDAALLENWHIVWTASAVGLVALIAASLKAREDRFEAFIILLNEFFYRAFRRTVSRMPFIMASLLLLLIPIPIFFETNEDALMHYALVLCLVPLPFIFIDSPFLEPFLRRQNVNGAESKRSDFILESAWFGRLGFMLDDEIQARLLLSDLEGFLTSRRIPHASALRAVNIIWAFEKAPTKEELEKIAEHCQKANFRFIILSDEVQHKEGGPFEEVRTKIALKTAS